MSTVESTPFMAPRMRSRRTSERVSIPSMPDDPVAVQVGVQVAAGAEIAHPAAPLAER